MSFQILKDCWHCYQNTVNEAKGEYFANLISSNSHNPCVLCKTIGSVLNTPPDVSLEVSSEKCNNFLNFFIEKVVTTRALITAPDSDPYVCVPCTAIFTQFELVTLSFLEDVVRLIKPGVSPRDPFPSQFFKEIFPSIGQSVLEIINSSLVSGVVPANFKHAVVQPLLKKPGLDHTVLANYRPISKLPLLFKVLEKKIIS